MTYLELRTNNTIYDLGWNITESIWAPITKENGDNWAFWRKVSEVIKGDLIFHIQQINSINYFIGYSFAATDGYVTNASPTTLTHGWSYSKEFYKADLQYFKELTPRIPVKDYFLNNEVELRRYYAENASSINKRNLFYTIQKGKLQCLFGAYFSNFDRILSELLVNDFVELGHEISLVTATDTAAAKILKRIGHQIFADNVKKNFNYKCCFPNCSVEGKGFLISGHIARWSDNENLRGHTSNGLCLCLFHDKAFEMGFFTLDNNYRVALHSNKLLTNQWLEEFLKNGQNLEIKERQVNPSLEALQQHWIRIGHR